MINFVILFLTSFCLNYSYGVYIPVCTKDDAFFAYPGNCTKFIHCNAGNSIVFDCPIGTVFNSDLNRCSPSQNTDECNENIRSRKSISVQCPPNVISNYPDPMDCRKFIQCHLGTLHRRNCGPGTYYNPTIDGCDWPQNVAGCTDNLGNGKHCRGDVTFYEGDNHISESNPQSTQTQSGQSNQQLSNGNHHHHEHETNIEWNKHNHQFGSDQNSPVAQSGGHYGNQNHQTPPSEYNFGSNQNGYQNGNGHNHGPVQSENQFGNRPYQHQLNQNGQSSGNQQTYQPSESGSYFETSHNHQLSQNGQSFGNQQTYQPTGSGSYFETLHNHQLNQNGQNYENQQSHQPPGSSSNFETSHNHQLNQNGQYYVNQQTHQPPGSSSNFETSYNHQLNQNGQNYGNQQSHQQPGSSSYFGTSQNHQLNQNGYPEIQNGHGYGAQQNSQSQSNHTGGYFDTTHKHQLNQNQFNQQTQNHQHDQSPSSNGAYDNQQQYPAIQKKDEDEIYPIDIRIDEPQRRSAREFPERQGKIVNSPSHGFNRQSLEPLVGDINGHNLVQINQNHSQIRIYRFKYPTN